MKKALLLICIGFISVCMYSQDSINAPRILMRPYFENGIDFLRNDILKENYETGTKYFWGFGAHFGYPDVSSAMLYFQYTRSKYTLTKDLAYDLPVDSVLSTNQFSTGFIFPLAKIDKFYFRARMGYSLSLIKESFYSVNELSHGIQAGIGLERKFVDYSRIYIDLVYNYNKVPDSKFRDFDMFKLCLGFIL